MVISFLGDGIHLQYFPHLQSHLCTHTLNNRKLQPLGAGDCWLGLGVSPVLSFFSQAHCAAQQDSGSRATPSKNHSICLILKNFKLLDFLPKWFDFQMHWGMRCGKRCCENRVSEPGAHHSPGVLPCNPLPGVKHLVCSNARATTAPLSMLVIESTWRKHKGQVGAHLHDAVSRYAKIESMWREAKTAGQT